MFHTQSAITEIKRFIKRRRVLLFLSPVLLVGISVAAALYLPPKYESSISILVDRDETLNPMIQYSMAVAMASEDRMRSFNEIIYSRSTMNMLIDSLGLDDETMTRAGRDDLRDKIRGDIRTNLRASDSFSISFLNRDPQLAQKGVELLADHFIQTRLSLENRRNDQTVDFFESKLEELEQAVEERGQRIMTQMQENIDRQPREERSIQSDIESVDSEMNEIERRIGSLERSLEFIQSVNSGSREISDLRERNFSGIPSAGELRDLLNQHSDYTQRYTRQFPQVRETEAKIYDLLDRMAGEIDVELFEQQAEQMYLQEQRTELIRQLEQTAISQEQRSGSRSDYEVYKAMLDDMKVKVEQARSTQALGDRAENQFVVIDPAEVPEKPAKPNRTLLVAGGLFIGVFLGVVGAGIAEILDTTIRTPEDLKKFNRPVVAYIPSSSAK